MAKTKDAPRTEEPKTDVAIQPAAPQPFDLSGLGVENEKFLALYEKDLIRISQELPGPQRLQQIIDALPEADMDNVSQIIKKVAGKRKGLYADSARPDFPELRLFHGTGKDPNRPKNTLVGQYYLNSNENVGDEFVGAVLAIWEGRTMWGDRDAGEDTSMPLCQSMDRKTGHVYGNCEKCPNRPWRQGQKTKCSDDVVAYMLTRDLREIVLVRFAKTSEPAGKQLIRNTRRSTDLWSKWYKITAEEKTSTKDKTWRWYVMKVSTVVGNDALVSEHLYPFCDAMCSVLEASIIMPKLADIYRSAKSVVCESDDSDDKVSTDTPVDAKTDYGDFEGTPDKS